MRELESKFTFFMLIFVWASGVESKCSKGCDLALASYYIWNGTNLKFIADLFDTKIENILSFNPDVPDKDKVQIGSRIDVPFNCNCIEKQFLGHRFAYHINTGDSYSKIGEKYYANLTTVAWLTDSNIYDANNIPNVDTTIDVIVNCSCGDKKVSKEYGLFVTYPLRPGENLTSIANQSGVPSELLQKYNPSSDFSSGSGLVYIPGRDQTGNFPRLKISTGISSGVIAGIAVGVAGVLFLAFCLCAGFYKRKKGMEVSFLPEASKAPGSGRTTRKASETTALVASPGLTSITVDKSVEFSYEELAKATNDFSMANKIGQGGFGAVYYGELRGEKAAIKKMEMRASKEFYAELKILTNVHHLNLVRLMGYCADGSLFLVYEFIENGDLSQHLRGSDKEPLPWSTRMQIALDSATGLEYIHEHTVPVYIHRDIKSANILLDKNFRAKVGDFGLTKLTKSEDKSSVTKHPIGTIGYMSPEYFQYGEVSPKVDVYAFGVVLFEIISAKGAIMKRNEALTQPTALVALFEDVLSQPDPGEDLRKLVDLRLGDNYPLDSILKMAQLARACTEADPQLRPSMREIVVVLTTLSSETKEWNVSTFRKNKAMLNLMSGK
ncbi:chitin elicitor receptor kinase 1-like isoform X2 [Mangifera indica]|uniref:chitin elicitor receptor kinase 1-like isoform X2 n=1 Tax=Mangifera indica TaxID=29780 RepID=UPI001CF9F483|nr:chitin elicitor receptor kinase 1-like isoform X2 [Mangifera indica]